LFISFPKALVKPVRIPMIFLASLSDAYPYNIMPYTNYWWVNGSSFSHSLRPICCSLLTFAFIYLPRSSAARINKKGESGSSCLSPLVALNASVRDPFSIIDKNRVVTIDIIQLIYISSKSNSFSIRCRYSKFNW